MSSEKIECTIYTSSKFTASYIEIILILSLTAFLKKRRKKKPLQPQMNAVPKELWSSIMAFVEPSAFGNVRGVCSDFHGMSPEMKEVRIEVMKWNAIPGRRGKSVMLKEESFEVKISNYESVNDIKEKISHSLGHELLSVDGNGKILSLNPALPIWTTPGISMILVIPDNTVLIKKDVFEPYIIKPTTQVQDLASRAYVTYLLTTDSVTLNTSDKVSKHKILYGSY